MNGVQISDEFLDLSADTSVELVLRNPIYADDYIIPGSYSLPFTVPGGDRNEKNARLLKHPDVIENIDARYNIPDTRYWYDGILLKRGKLQVDNTERGDFSLNFLFGLGTVADNFKTAKIRDICNADVVMSASVYTKRVDIICRTTTFPGTYKIIVNGRTYEGTTNAALASAINADATEPRATATYISTPHPVHGAEAPDYFRIEPSILPGDINTQLTITLENVRDPNLYQHIIIDSSTFESEYNDDVLDWLNTNFYLETPLDERMYFPMLRNNNLYEKDDAIFKGRYGSASYDYRLMNAVYDGTGYVLNKPYDSYLVGFGPWNRTSLAPMIRIKWVMDQISTFFGIELEGDFLDDPDYIRGFFYHSNTLDMKVPFLGDVPWLATRRSFNVNEFLPDWTAVDLLKNIQTKFNVAVYYNELTGKIRLQKREPVIQSKVYEDISALSSPASPPKLNTLTGIRLEAERDKDDLLSFDDFYETGDPNLVIKTSLASMPRTSNFKISLNNGIRTSTGVTVLLPESQRPIDQQIPGVLAYYSWKETVGGGNFFYPTADIALTDGESTFDGINGLAEKRWKNYLRFLLKRKLVSIRCDLDIPHINRLDWELKRRFDRSNYLYDTIKVTLTNRRIKQASVDIWTV